MLRLVRRAMSTISPAKILSQVSYQAAGKLNITEHFFSVPLDHSKPDSDTIKLFCRSARKHETYPNEAKNNEQLPWMLYLQGGPGGECRPPQTYPYTQIMLDKGYQMLFLDQRGTGLSTPVTASTLQMKGDDKSQADYLKHFRADSIVKDAEAMRMALTADYPDDKKKWSIMGQSFGGFCSITYLSFYPEGLRESFIFGGLQPLVTWPDEVYKRCYLKVLDRNKAYYAKYPADIARVKRILAYLSKHDTLLPSGVTLKPRRFQQIGIGLGFHGGVDSIHDVVLRCHNELETFGHLTRSALSAIEDKTSFDNGILYSLIHEPIYCSGSGNAANWSADRMRSAHPEFSIEPKEGDDTPVFFTGEMIYPWMFDDYAELRHVKGAAELIAQAEDWPELFALDQLAKNEVPVCAAAYVEDMYVDFGLSMGTASKIKGCKVFSTNVMFHDAVRSKMDEVVKQAFALRDDVVD